MINFSLMDLSRIQLIQQDLRGANFRGSRLDGSNFEFSYLTKSIFSSCSLVKANFSHTDLNGSAFEYSLLRQADFYRSKLNDSSFIKANAPKANFTNADVVGSSLSRADFRGANFRGANLTGVDFVNSDLTGANFKDAILVGANLRGATLSYAKFNSADLTGADFTGAIMLKGQIKNARETDGVKIDQLIARSPSPRIPTKEDLRQQKADFELYIQRNIEMPEKRGLFDLVASAEEDIRKGTEATAAMQETMKKFNENLQARTQEIEKAKNLDNAAKKKLIDRVGNEILEHAKRLKRLTEQMSAPMQRAFVSYRQLPGLINDLDADKRETYATLQKSILGVVKSLDDAIVIFYKWLDAVNKLPELSTELNRGKRELENAIQNLLDVMRRIKYMAISAQSHFATTYRAGSRRE